MSINRAEKITMWTALVAIFSFILVRCFHSELYMAIPERMYLFVHSGMEFIGFAISFTMLVLGWLFFAKSLSKHRLYTAALFSAIGLFDLLHALTSRGMPYYMTAGETSLSALFSDTAQVVGAVGLFVIFRKNDAPIRASRRLPAFALSLGLAATVAILYYMIAEQSSVPVLVGKPLELLRWLVHFVIIFAYISTITMVLYLNRTERPQALLTIIQSLVFFTIASLQFILGSNDHGSDLLFGHLYKLAGYYFLMKGIYYVTIYEPFKQEKRSESRINYLAYHDELTGLSNRRLLKDKLDEELTRARLNDSRLAVFLFDIDRFKNVNDALGHSFGDQMLLAVSDRLRYAAGNGNHLFRMGGDEFVMLMPDIQEAEDERVEKQAKAIMGLFDAPFVLGDAEYHITISLGISFFPRDGESVEVLLKNADTAMYSAKAHRNEYSSYEPEMNQKSHDRLRLESDLRKAIEQEQFSLAYQPLVNLTTGKVVGVEALVRWNHPKRGLLPPGEFIPLTEENGLILQLGEWVLRAACKQNVAWQQAGLPQMMMSVNLSMRQFRQHQLAERIKEILEQTGMPPQFLELEITESMTSDVEFAAETLTSLKELGVQISIDDFGTGYSSLVSLKRFPIDKLKIDRSFVGDLSQGGSDAAIVSTITTMAKNLKLKVTAEGVENDEQIKFLRESNCEEAQGFYFTKPIPANLFENWFRHRSQSA
ncbi:bifunctional diguanylate cyclase/phosphodiesterase [Paenibacillus sp. OV219]|uniref:putative bifunctional diguanylate cyclase/phosphodiesterase n=1 Tax=Paenibacillus sp. OV219 TaxID=1884377 RepID=UPI0008CE46AC|nr:EAL domain-containing protein [Paenibacillus sp. OV219]SEN78724.1 diguanylate cyclase (GGDEF) domain-containing protein [Paenibacillus sp. OV219]